MQTEPIITSTASTIGRFRWRIGALIALANTINYVDRQVLGLLAPDLETQFGWSEIEYGSIVTAFQGAFALGYLLFGWFIDRYGTKLGYAVAITLWSLAAVGHGWARTVGQFGLARALLGLGEGGNTPAAIKAFAEYFPRHERAFITGIFTAGSSLGAVLAPVVVPVLAVRFGWQMAFFATGRKTVMLASALLITPIVGAAFTQNLWLAVCLIALAAAAHQSWSTVLFTTVSDQFPKPAVASVVGIGGMAGAVGGMLIATATGYLLDATGSYLPIFAGAASVYLLALGLFQRIVPTIGREHRT